VATSLTTGLDDTEKVTVAFVISVAAAEQGRRTLMFLTKEAAPLAMDGFATGPHSEGCPPLVSSSGYAYAGVRYFVGPICFDVRKLDAGERIPGAETDGTAPIWQWIGDEMRDHLQLLTSLPRRA